MLESGLRKELGQLWSGPDCAIHWIEAAIGGTFGIADAMLLGKRSCALSRRMLPCELKRGEYQGSDIAVTIRPAQRIYHNECFAFAVATIFLAVVGEDIYGLPGHIATSYKRLIPVRHMMLVNTSSDIMLLDKQAHALIK
jgi:hypothetical protein